MCHGGLARLDVRHRQQRRVQARGEEARAGAGQRAVNGGEQRRTALAGVGLGQLERAPRRGVQRHRGGNFESRGRLERGRAAALCGLHILQERGERHGLVGGEGGGGQGARGVEVSNERGGGGDGGGLVEGEVEAAQDGLQSGPRGERRG